MIDIKAYQPGSIVEISGIRLESGEEHRTWAILTVQIELRESDNLLRSHEMVQMLTLLAVDAEGTDLGRNAITVNSDMYDLTEL